MTDDITLAPDPIDAEVSRRAEEESEQSLPLPPKRRIGGRHPDLLPGEVGPCTRCGWVWTPSSATYRRVPSGLPRRCANCRTDYWMLAPVSDRARRPSDPEWATRRDTITNRKKRRRVERFKQLADELGVEVLNEPPPPKPVVKPEPPPLVIPAAVDMSPPLPWQRKRAIPPPPGLVAEEDKR